MLYNEIIYQEVYQHIEENLTKAVSEYNKVIEGNRAFAPFRMDEKWGEKISQIKPDAMVSELRKRWDDYIDDTCATKISMELGVETEEAKRLVGILKKYGIVKAVKASKPEYEDLSNRDIILTDVVENNPEIQYVFDFVGVVMVEEYQNHGRIDWTCRNHTMRSWTNSD